MQDEFGFKSNFSDDDEAYENLLPPMTPEEEKRLKIRLMKEKIQYYQDIINKLMMEYYALDNEWHSDDGLD